MQWNSNSPNLHSSQLTLAARLLAALGVLLWLALTSAGAALAQDGGKVTLHPQEIPHKDGDGALGASFNVTLNGDVTAAGVGLRGSGSGVIVLDGVPAGASVHQALLYWGTIGSNGTFTNPTLNGTPVDGQLIGTAADTCWDAANNFSYRADVTAIVTGNGNYTVNGLPNTDPTTDDSQGASLVVIYSLPTAPRRAIVIVDGAAIIDTASGNGPLAQTIPISDFTPSGSGVTHLVSVVGDGQDTFPSGELFLDATLVSTDDMVGADGDYWDTKIYDLSAFSPADPATVRVLGSYDCLLLTAKILSVEGEGHWIFADGFESGDTSAW